MAVVMDEETVYAFAHDAEVAEGRTLLADGAVIEAESEPRGICGLVRDGSGAACGVWVRVVGRELTAECDGSCNLVSGRLCRHAVALSLHAVERGMSWQAVPVDDTCRPPVKPWAHSLPWRRPRCWTGCWMPAPNCLQKPISCPYRCWAPQARAELSALQEKTASEVEQALRALDVTHLSTGYRAGFGYTDVYEAASRLIGPVIERYEADVRRRLALGMPDAAEAVALGVLDGLDACEGDYDGDEVLCCAGEGLAETYGYKIRELMLSAGRAVD
ncbi:hypothetical protein ABT112_11945 [Streptomyces sp. NPDC002055]|uniref:hypothetical protein n=1 Tax=Streptomyces sp. NPDC002055 TaxID=3154534 RepID=UPI003325701A